MRDKLRILADWLKNAESGIDSYHDGHLEATFKRAKQESITTQNAAALQAEDRIKKISTLKSFYLPYKKTFKIRND